MARNIALLTQVRNLIEADSSKLDMGLWAAVSADVVEFKNGSTAKVSCGTTACIAGWTVQIAGDQLLVNRHSYDEDDDGNKIYNTSRSVDKNGRVCNIEGRARKLLGLTGREAHTLFVTDNDQVVGLLNILIAGDDLPIDDADEDEDI